MRYFSLFTGIGGFEFGIQHAYENNNRPELSKGNTLLQYSDDHSDELERESVPVCVGYSEIDKYAIQIYQSRFPEHKNYGDITKIKEDELPDFDLLCGGFPCQSFSIAGKRGGFADTRGTLFFDIARLLKAKQPRLLLLENVKGLLSHDEGRTFGTIVSTLDELGYDLQWEVLNSKDFGVPQNRERILIVGHLRGTPRPEVFPIGATDSDPDAGSSEREERHARTVDTQGGTNGRGTHVAIAKTVRSGGRASPHGSKQNWDSYEYEGRIRHLTPTECERLQGFPDGWTEGVSDSQRYKCLGNAVTTNVIEAVISRIIQP